MNAHRLILLADFLQGRGRYRRKGLNKKKFWMGSWQQSAHDLSGKIKEGLVDGMSEETKKYIGKTKKGKPFKGKANNVIPIQCKTVGCALGWAATLPELRRAGLKLVRNEFGFEEYAVPEYKGSKGFYAAVGFFDISMNQAEYLFDPMDYGERNVRDIDYVANRIRDIAAGGKVPKRYCRCFR